MIANVVAGEKLEAGDVVYLSNDGKAVKFGLVGEYRIPQSNEEAAAQLQAEMEKARQKGREVGMEIEKAIAKKVFGIDLR